MKHAREDYNRFQDPLGLIPDNEPVFLLRGQDKVAPLAVKLWADILELINGENELSAKARHHADRMESWQRRIKSKYPDL